MTKYRKIAYIELLIVSIIWGVAAPIIKYTLQFFPPFVFLSYRMAISFIIGVFVLSKIDSSEKKLNKNTILLIVYSILAVPIALGLLFIGFTKTTSLTGTLISATAPIIAAIAGMKFLHEHVTKKEKSGMTLALLGTVITIFGPLFLMRNHTISSSFSGNIIIFASLLAGTAAGILLKKLLQHRMSPYVIISISFMISLPIFIYISFVTYSTNDILISFLNAPLSAHLGVFYMAILSGNIAYYLHSKAIKSIELSEAAIFTYLYPIWAAPLSLLWLKEKITTPFVIGAVLIAIGVFYAETKKRRL